MNILSWLKYLDNIILWLKYRDNIVLWPKYRDNIVLCCKFHVEWHFAEETAVWIRGNSISIYVFNSLWKFVREINFSSFQKIKTVSCLQELFCIFRFLHHCEKWFNKLYLINRFDCFVLFCFLNFVAISSPLKTFKC